MFTCNHRTFLDGLDRADLVVGMHDADQDSVGGNRATEVVGIDSPGAIDRQKGHRRAQAFQKAQRRHDRRMLYAGGDEMRM